MATYTVTLAGRDLPSNHKKEVLTNIKAKTRNMAFSVLLTRIRSFDTESRRQNNSLITGLGSVLTLAIAR